MTGGSRHQVAALTKTSQANKPQYTVWPVFQDYAVRLQHDGSKSSTGIYSWGAGDRYTRAAGELDILDPVEAQQTPQFAYRESFGVHGVKHQWANDKHNGRVVGAVVPHLRGGELDTGSFEDLRTLTATSRGDISVSVKDKSRVNTGWEIRSGRTAVTADGAESDGLLIGTEAPILARAQPVDRASMRHQIGAYTEGQIWLGNIVALPGFRIDSDTLAGTMQGQPRLTLRWEAAEQTHLKVSGGFTPRNRVRGNACSTHRCPRRAPDRSASASSKPLPPVSSFSLRPIINSSMTHSSFRQPDRLKRRCSAGRMGQSLSPGTEFETSFFCGLGLPTHVPSGSLTARVSSPSDQPIAGGLVSSWQLSDNWTLGLRYRAATGLPYTPVTDSLYSAGSDTWRPILGPLNTERFPFYHRLDLRAATRWRFPEWTLSLTLDLILVPPVSTQLYPTWNFDWTQTTWVNGPALLPLFTLRADY